jgi:hypothetical protein
MIIVLSCRVGRISGFIWVLWADMLRICTVAQGLRIARGQCITSRVYAILPVINFQLEFGPAPGR